MRKVLLTGAAGRIGRAFLQSARNSYNWICVDRNAPSFPIGTETWVQANLEDLNCNDLCTGIDTVIHLAADPSPDADFFESLLANNIIPTYKMFEAAAQAGCRRFIFASSIQTIEGYPLDVQVQDNMPVRPKNVYGASKCFGEALAAYYAYQRGLSTIALRIGKYSEFGPERLSARDRSAYISPRDLHELLIRCIEHPRIDFGIFPALSGNRFPRQNAYANVLLNYNPQDDGFFDLSLTDKSH